MVTTMNGQVRSARRAADVTQEELAAELGCSVQAYRLFERLHAALPRGATPSDALDAILRVAQRKAQEQAQQ